MQHLTNPYSIANVRKLTVPQAARMARVHPDTIRIWVRKGILPDRRPPGTRKIILLESDLVRDPQGVAA